MSYWIFQGGPETEWLLEKDSPFDQYFWTANKHVQVGEVAFIYLTAPISKIVAGVNILKEPFFNAAATSMFDNEYMYDKWCVEVGNTHYYGQHEDLSMRNMRKLFSLDWGWVRYPRGSTRIPDEIVSPFLEMMSPHLPSMAINTEYHREI
ncbi:MAG TPA: hypothetical protein VHQ01_12215 [Pyrinomonadaceae bacterium]|jgi:hypothetical protein|nr:hypothetical protein [Pyrinomonadaceae bacterium]